MGRLPFRTGEDQDCALHTGNGLFIASCPGRHFVLNAAELLRTGNRGVVDFGTGSVLSSVEDGVGSEMVSIVDSTERVISIIVPRHPEDLAWSSRD